MKYLLQADSIPITKNKYVVLGSDNKCHIQDNTKFTGDIVTLNIYNSTSISTLLYTYNIFDSMTWQDFIDLNFKWNFTGTKIRLNSSSNVLLDMTEWISSSSDPSNILPTDIIDISKTYGYGVRPPQQEGDL